jgi:hypothetical protein
MAKVSKPGRAATQRGNRKGDQTRAGKGGRTQSVKDYEGALGQDVLDEVGQAVSGRDRSGGRSGGGHRGGRGGGVGTADTIERGGEATEVGLTPRKLANATKSPQAKRQRAPLAKPTRAKGRARR